MAEPVRYGMQLRLRHVSSARVLKSIARSYQHPNSSGQQMVVASTLKNSQTLWILKGPTQTGEAYAAGETVRHGDTIRLEHVATHKNLHSHNWLSPLSQQQEVTAFGESGRGDENDDWVVELGGPGQWNLDEVVTLKHKLTNKVLHSHQGWVHHVYTAGEQEVTCLQQGDANDLWVCAAEDQLPQEKQLAVGVALPKTWVEYLSVIGSIASITGWTLVTLKQSLSNLPFFELLGYLFSSSLVLGALLMVTSQIARFYRRETFNPRPLLWRIGFWSIASTAYVLTLLISWRASILAASHILVPLLKWIFRST